MTLLRHVREFFATETAGGVVMIAAAVLALVLANSPFSHIYQAVIAAPLFGAMDVGGFTKDVLMVIFFFAIGMELKIEMREGALAAKGQKMLPLVAALGGIAVPAFFYLAITQNHPQLQAGWAIPTATDIAFAMCVLGLVGARVPAAAKVFLLAIAIYDDLAAIIIIAVFYSSGLALMPLVYVALLILALAVLNRVGACHLPPYLAVGVALWFALHHAGIHPTVAGVLTAVAIPLRGAAGAPLLAPLLHRLHLFVAFAILPLFAFTSAGVDVRSIPLVEVFSVLPIGIALALFFGKQFGILGATFVAVRLKLAGLPRGVDWGMVYGIAILAGIGFTMSLFIGNLAFSEALLLDEVKIGVLAGSLLSSLFGLIYLCMRRTA